MSILATDAKRLAQRVVDERLIIKLPQELDKINNVIKQACDDGAFATRVSVGRNEDDPLREAVINDLLHRGYCIGDQNDSAFTISWGH